MNMSEAEHNVRVINVAPGLIRTAIHQKRISFEQYCEMLGNLTFISPAELAAIVLSLAAAISYLHSRYRDAYRLHF